MPEYDDSNTFVLFENDKQNEKQPDYKGSLTDENGKKWDIAVWNKTSRNGKDFLSGKISEPYVKPESDGKVWEQTRERYKKEDVVIDDISDEPISLEDIPFN